MNTLVGLLISLCVLVKGTGELISSLPDERFTSSSTKVGGYQAAKVRDKNPYNWFQSEEGGTDTNQWLQIDMGSSKTVIGMLVLANPD